MRKIYLMALCLIYSVSIFAQLEFSQESAEKFLKVLAVDIGPRPMGSPAEQKALKFAVEKFKEFGCDTSYIMPMTFTSTSNTTTGIAIGVKKGISKKIIVLGGHIDSAGPEIPGADDDGSGSAVIIELARILKTRETQSTIVYALFGGEEQGLEGSTYFTNFFPEIDSVVLMLQVDMANGLGILEIDPNTYGQSAPKWLVNAAIEEYNKLGYKKLRYPTHAYVLNNAFGKGAGSDHEPFLDKGIPAIDFTSDISNPIHTPQDNFKNFDARGLKRSGDLVLKLVERFDKGVPSRNTERYWMYMIGKTPIFFPLWSLTLFVVISILTAIIAFISVRSRRLVVTQALIIDTVTNKPMTNPRRWTGFKMILFALIPVVFAWFSFDLMGLLKGLRFPWYTSITSYLILSILFGLVGLWISLQIEKKIKLAKCPYVFFKRFAIIMAIFVVAAGVVHVPIAVYPACALLFISLAVLIRVQLLKILFFTIAPIVIFRFIFNEWFSFSARLFTMVPSTEMMTLLISVVVNAVFIVLLLIVVLPFFFAFGAVYRETPALKSLMARFKAGKTLFMVFIAIGVLSVYLYTEPSYNERYQKSVKVKQIYDDDKKDFKIFLSGTEYLDSLKIKHGGKDTLLLDKIMRTSIMPEAQFDTSKFKIAREIKKTTSNDTTYFDVGLKLDSKLVPYVVVITYNGRENFRKNLTTEWKFKDTEKKIAMKWYSFPKMPLIVPIKFYLVGNDSVREDIRITYADLFYPMEFKRELTNFIKRTEIKQSMKYSNN
jgi:hypothetical protein